MKREKGFGCAAARRLKDNGGLPQITVSSWLFGQGGLDMGVLGVGGSDSEASMPMEAFMERSSKEAARTSWDGGGALVEGGEKGLVERLGEEDGEKGVVLVEGSMGAGSLGDWKGFMVLLALASCVELMGFGAMEITGLGSADLWNLWAQFT